MGVRESCRAAKALGMLVLLVGSIAPSKAQDRRESLEALERERMQALRDAQARSAPQWSGVQDPASGADLQNLGSRWSVRGFDAQGFLTGQEQITWRQDLRFAGFAAAWLPGVQMQPYLGLDYGRISAAAPAALKPGRVLAGAAAGLRWGGHGLSGDMALAAPLHKPEGFAASSAVVYASLNFNY